MVRHHHTSVTHDRSPSSHMAIVHHRTCVMVDVRGCVVVHVRACVVVHVRGCVVVDLQTQTHPWPLFFVSISIIMCDGGCVCVCDDTDTCMMM